jgi:PQQ-dependent catabolism-associated CXXCW motif protein
MKTRRSLLGLAVALPAFGAFQKAFAAGPPEPDGYRLDDYHTPTPETLDGKPALTIEGAIALWREPKALFIDVATYVPRPEGLTPGTFWQEKPHVSIPRAIWLPEVGRGALAPETETYFRRSLAEVTKADYDAVLIFFCKRACWMSWNAAKRARTFGYRKVNWYADGIEGWREAGLPTEVIAPRP